MPAPVASGWSDRRVGLAPTGKAPPCHGARGKPSFAGPVSNSAYVFARIARSHKRGCSPRPTVKLDNRHRGGSNSSRRLDIRGGARLYPQRNRRYRRCTAEASGVTCCVHHFKGNAHKKWAQNGRTRGRGSLVRSVTPRPTAGDRQRRRLTYSQSVDNPYAS
jgi:hypothetical protein